MGAEALVAPSNTTSQYRRSTHKLRLKVPPGVFPYRFRRRLRAKTVGTLDYEALQDEHCHGRGGGAGGDFRGADQFVQASLDGGQGGDELLFARPSEYGKLGILKRPFRNI